MHINYLPCDGRVEYAQYNHGKFHRANTPGASVENASTFIGLSTPFGRIAFKQIAGYTARRIICRLRLGDEGERGQKIGMIKFGSRMEIFLPSGADVMVVKGDRVRAAESIIAIGREN